MSAFLMMRKGTHSRTLSPGKRRPMNLATASSKRTKWKAFSTGRVMKRGMPLGRVTMAWRFSSLDPGSVRNLTSRLMRRPARTGKGLSGFTAIGVRTGRISLVKKALEECSLGPAPSSSKLSRRSPAPASRSSSSFQAGVLVGRHLTRQAADLLDLSRGRHTREVRLVAALFDELL